MNKYFTEYILFTCCGMFLIDCFCVIRILVPFLFVRIMVYPSYITNEAVYYAYILLIHTVCGFTLCLCVRLQKLYMPRIFLLFCLLFLQAQGCAHIVRLYVPHKGQWWLSWCACRTEQSVLQYKKWYYMLFLAYETKCNLEAETNKTGNHGSFLFCSKCLLLMIHTKLMEMLS